MNCKNLLQCLAPLVAGGELQQARVVGRALLAQRPGFNLHAYRARIPFRDDALRALHVEHLRMARIPETG